MAELTTLNIQPNFLGKDIYVSREITDIASSNRYGVTTPGYREYAASSEAQPAFVIRVENVKKAPKLTKRQKVTLIGAALTYVTERNANRRAIDVPIIIAEEVKFEGGKA